MYLESLLYLLTPNPVINYLLPLFFKSLQFKILYGKTNGLYNKRIFYCITNGYFIISLFSTHLEVFQEWKMMLKLVNEFIMYSYYKTIRLNFSIKLHLTSYELLRKKHCTPLFLFNSIYFLFS